MTRARAALAAALLAVAVSSGNAFAGSPASANASCVGTITSYEASHLQPGAVGTEVSGLATSAPGLAGGMVSGLAKEHAGSIDACLGGEG